MDIFYDIDKSVTRELFYEAKELSFNCWCDEKHHLDWKRIKSIKTFDEIFKFAEDSKFSHFVFIHRKSQDLKKEIGDFIEIGLNVPVGDTEFYIFIEVSIDKLDYLTNKYNIKQQAKIEHE